MRRWARWFGVSPARLSLAGRWFLVARVGFAASGADGPPVSADFPSGRELVEKNCQSCHVLPDPSLLDRSTWVTEALKYMGPWLGLSRPNYDRAPDGAVLREAHLFPDEPLFSREQWRSVVQHYASLAPLDPPPQPARIPLKVGLPGFRAEPIRLGDQPAFVTLVSVDAEHRRIFVGDGQDKSLRTLDGTGRTLWRLPVPSGPVSLARQGSDWVVTLIGRVFPSDERAGQVWRVADGGRSGDGVPLLHGLRRPVHTSVVDLDRDGRDELVVSAYGNRMGNLSVFRSGAGARDDGEGWKETVLEEYPGTLRTVPMDWNGDGRMDLLVLRAQAREGLGVMINDGEGGYEPRRLVDFPPTFGAVAMELADLDGDGVSEILVVNGDSGDYPARWKAFHGLRVYGRSAGGGIEERWFHPMHGAYGVKARDFDGDGHTDMALISFFPDYTAEPLETFVLLRGLGGLRFEGFTLPAPEARAGRWLVMDAGDVDGDGDEDLVLGSFFRGPSTTPIPAGVAKGWETDPISVMLLRNTRK